MEGNILLVFNTTFNNKLVLLVKEENDLPSVSYWQNIFSIIWPL